MWEKLLLAATLTFALSLFAELGWISSSQITGENTRENLSVVTLSHRNY